MLPGVTGGPRTGRFTADLEARGLLGVGTAIENWSLEVALMSVK